MESSSVERVHVESRALELVTVVLAIRASLVWTLEIDPIRSVSTPTGIAKLIDLSSLYGTLAPWLVFGAIVASLLAGATGWNRHAYFASVALMHLQFCLRHVHGKVPHGENLVGLVLLAFAVANVVGRDTASFRRLSLGYATGALVTLYALAAVCKLVLSGPAWVHGAHLSLWISEKCVDAYSATGVSCRGWLADLAMRDHLVGTAILTSGLLTELASPLVFVERLRRPMLLAFFALHTGIWLVLGISFVSCQVILLTMAFASDIHGYVVRTWATFGRRAYALSRP